MSEDYNQMISESTFWQAEKVAGNDDLLSEILLRLPISSLLNFRCVSHHWCFLISNPNFRQLYCCRNAASTAGVFLFRKSDKNYHLDHVFKFSETTKNKVPSNMRMFIESFPSVEPMHYCNGLLCLKLRLDNDEVVYCVYNPCTNRYTNIPQPDMIEKDEIVAINLAFDPLKSRDYKIICVVKDMLGLFRFLKFSNESTWKELDQKVVRGDLYFGRGVFLNGGIHFVSKCTPFLCLDVDDDCLDIMPSTPIPEGSTGRKIKYFGESAGNLHLVEENELLPTLLNVFELKKDYSEWFVKYVVDLDDLTRLFPIMVINEPESLDVIGYQFDVLCFIDGEKEGKPLLMLTLPEKMISYNIKNMKIEKLVKMPLQELHLNMEGFLVYHYKWYHAYKYIETLALV